MSKIKKSTIGKIAAWFIGISLVVIMQMIPFQENGKSSSVPILPDTLLGFMIACFGFVACFLAVLGFFLWLGEVINGKYDN